MKLKFWNKDREIKELTERLDSYERKLKDFTTPRKDERWIYAPDGITKLRISDIVG